MDDLKAKQQLVEKIKASSSILVTVSNSPSVDSLASALALTLLLDKLEKHPTAVFSGSIPPAISFLEPEKTFDATTDSLRDFIIALDKSKADHLRYKVDGDAVKIFITPYKTTITSEDLEFSQGDYNVELVIALGVDDQAHIDAAIESHGQILHDADVVSVTAHDQKSTLGGIDWHDEKASSLSEMISGLAEALKVDKNTPLVDQAISTALLTGIVAETDRFSNTKTSSQVMNVAAQLMGAGADPQLISFKLQEGSKTPASVEETTPATDESTPKKNHATLSIDHEGETLADLDKRVRNTEEPVESTPAPEPEVESTNAYGLEIEAPVEAPQTPDAEEPTLGGALNATTEQAAEDSRRVAEDDRNRKILTHSAYLGGSNPSEVASLSDDTPEPDTSESPAIGALTHSAYSLDPIEAPASVAEPLSAPVSAPVIEPLPAPTPVVLPMPPAVPDFSQPPLTPGAPAIPVPATPQPELLGDILAPEPAAAPEATSAYALPDPLPEAQPAAPTDAPVPAPQTPANPAQFQIPGQS